MPMLIEELDEEWTAAVLIRVSQNLAFDDSRQGLLSLFSNRGAAGPELHFSSSSRCEAPGLEAEGATAMEAFPLFSALFRSLGHASLPKLPRPTQCCVRPC